MNYDEFTLTVVKYPKEQSNPDIIEAMYCGLGLAGEAGETVDKIKKWHRDGIIDYKAVALELGDTLYYLTRLANTLGFTLADIQHLNMEKLLSRKARGVLAGSGDNR